MRGMILISRSLTYPTYPGTSGRSQDAVIQSLRCPKLRATKAEILPVYCLPMCMHLPTHELHFLKCGENNLFELITKISLPFNRKMAKFHYWRSVLPSCTPCWVTWLLHRTSCVFSMYNKTALSNTYTGKKNERAFIQNHTVLCCRDIKICNEMFEGDSHEKSFGYDIQAFSLLGIILLPA